MIATRIKIGDNPIVDIYKHYGFIYIDADERTSAPIKKYDVTTYAGEAGEHIDNRTVFDAFDYTVKFLIECPNNGLSNANQKISVFNADLFKQASNSDTLSAQQVTFYNDFNRVKIVGYAEPIAQPKEFFRWERGLETLPDCAEVELKIRVANPSLCDFNLRDVLMGRFSDDSTETDWVCHINNQQVKLPVNPSTKEFKMFVDYPVTSINYLFRPSMDWQDNTPGKLEVLTEVPASFNKLTTWSWVLAQDTKMKTFPETALDLSNVTALDRAFAASWFTEIPVLNTRKVKRWQFAFQWTDATKIHGLYLDSAEIFTYVITANRTTHITLYNLGMGPCMTYDLRTRKWGVGSEDARKTLVDSLLTNSYDRVANNLSSGVVLTLLPETIALLTEDQITAITNKGYVITEGGGI